MSNYYLHFKSLHLIFLVSWFAGLFYIVRLFIYHTEANQQPDNEKVILQNQFVKMERLLWNVITTPAMVLTVTAGLLMLYFPCFWSIPKNVAVILLVIDHPKILLFLVNPVSYFSAIIWSL